MDMMSATSSFSFSHCCHSLCVHPNSRRLYLHFPTEPTRSPAWQHVNATKISEEMGPLQLKIPSFPGRRTRHCRLPVFVGLRLRRQFQ